ncbi:uncharacterized protein LOC107365913 [Tetranychus urticae]|uniref:Uncharacterized protein n=1 Tax=Tetranychus urticae TaxID=32264 RepID=T1KNG6_TETUR|nr:uncharacterized protein LOC107365913 [Tetranychus urticae]
MRLTNQLLKWKGAYIGPMPKYPGKVTTGKTRWVPPVWTGTKADFFYELSATQEAMNVLAKPYISKDQESKLLQHQGKTKPDHWDDFMWKKYVAPPKHRYAAHFMACLPRTRKFEDED